MSAAARLTDWNSRYAAAVRDIARLPFAWRHPDAGSIDCVRLAWRVATAIRGRAPCDLPAYEDARGAIRALRQRAGIDGRAPWPDMLCRAASAVLGQGIPPASAAIGDIVLLAQGRRAMLGVCNGATAITAAQPRGLAHIPMSAAVAAWQV